MNTTLSTTVEQHHDQHGHPPHRLTSARQENRGDRRVSLVDRTALHVGVALVKWSRRSRPGTLSVAGERDTRAREWAAERSLLLTIPRR